MKTTIITTTINVPVALEKYGQNARFYGHQDLRFVVIGDKKTPAGAREFCESVTRRYYPCDYLDVDDQANEYRDKYPALWNHLPFNSIQRRNFGLLKAWEDGADVIITIDDDNFMLNHDFVAQHGVVGTAPELPAVESSSGWFNVCSVLEEANGTPFYHRGYPRAQRWKENENFYCTAPIKRRVAVNAGLWLDDPDIDAMTRLERPIVVKGVKAGYDRFALQPGTWCPFNSQNTALLREVIPAYFVSPTVGRYDDIWPSYFVVRIAQHLGDVIAYGQPHLRQKRNEHVLWRDLDNERIGMLLTDELCEALRGITFEGSTYSECFGELGRKLPAAWPAGEKWTDAMRAAREGLIEGINVWHGVFSGRTETVPAETAGVHTLARQLS